jgi:hypothetical protein
MPKPVAGLEGEKTSMEETAAMCIGTRRLFPVEKPAA